MPPRRELATAPGRRLVHDRGILCHSEVERKARAIGKTPGRFERPWSARRRSTCFGGGGSFGNHIKLNGRVRLGVGVGWSKDELDAVGSSLRERGARADEFLDVLRAIWTTDPVEFHGRFYRIPRSVVGLEPVQKPHPPVYLATYVQAGLDRIGRRADGWNPVGLPVEAMTVMAAQMREAARAAAIQNGEWTHLGRPATAGETRQWVYLGNSG